eukprot:7537515-Ditylum_brightwellii.AAC.1
MRWRTIAMADRTKNKAAGQCIIDRPSKYKIKMNYKTLFFKLHLPGYKRQLDYCQERRPSAMRKN